MTLRHGIFTEDILPTPAPTQPVNVGAPIPVKQIGRRYYNSIVGITEAGQVPSNCNEMTFLNQGASIVVVNGVLTLNPGAAGSLGESVEFDGKPGEVDVTVYDITFTGAGPNMCVVFRKNYQ